MTLTEVMTVASSSLLAGVVVSFSGALEASAVRRKELKRLVAVHGGEVAYILSKKVTHLLVGEEDVAGLMHQQQPAVTVDSRVRKAQEVGAHVVSDRWLLDSIAAHALLDELPYSYTWKQHMIAQGMKADTDPEEYYLQRLMAGIRDLRAITQIVGGVGDSPAKKARHAKDRRAEAVQRTGDGHLKEGWAVSLQEKRNDLLVQRRLEKERKRREEKERKRKEDEEARRRERENEKDWKQYRSLRKEEYRSEERTKKLTRLEVNWTQERVRIEIRSREKRKEKVIRMIMWERRKVEERNKELRNIKRAHDTKEARLALWEQWEDKKSAWRRQEGFESGRKIFVGGFKFDDLAEEGETKASFIIEKRKQHTRALLASFGAIHALREQWDKEYVFVVYKDREDAASAFEAMHDGDRRKAMVENIKRKLVDEGGSTSYAPLSTFYVRWPRQKYGRKNGSTVDANQEKKEDEEEKKRAEAKETKKLEKKERKRKEREERKEKRKLEKMQQRTAQQARTGEVKKKKKKQETGPKPKKGSKDVERNTGPTKKGGERMAKTNNGKRTESAKGQKNEAKDTKKRADRDRPARAANEKKPDKKKSTVTTNAIKAGSGLEEKRKTGKEKTIVETSTDRKVRREKEKEELQAKTLEELENGLEEIQCGRRELIRGWRRGWETPEETRRWQRILFEKEKKKRRLLRAAEKLRAANERDMAKREAANKRYMAKREARREKSRQEHAQAMLEYQQQALEMERRLEEARATMVRRREEEKNKRKRLMIEKEKARVMSEIERVRSALRLQKNRHRRMRKREEARKEALKEAARLEAQRRQEEARRGLVRPKAAPDVVHKQGRLQPQQEQPSPLETQTRERKTSGRDDTWMVVAFALLCVVVLGCALYL